MFHFFKKKHILYNGNSNKGAMIELNTKKGIILKTYTQEEIDFEIIKYMNNNNSIGCSLFIYSLKSFDSESNCCITESEAIELVGVEVKKNKNNPTNLYTNYNGNPFGLYINGVRLYFSDPILSLKSAFKAAAPSFDFKKDFFNVNLKL